MQIKTRRKNKTDENKFLLARMQDEEEKFEKTTNKTIMRTSPCFSISHKSRLFKSEKKQPFVRRSTSLSGEKQKHFRITAIQRKSKCRKCKGLILQLVTFALLSIIFSQSSFFAEVKAQDSNAKQQQKPPISHSEAAVRAEINKIPPNIYKWIEDNGHICAIVPLVGENLVSFLSVDEGSRCSLCPDPGPRQVPRMACAVETSPNDFDIIAVKCQQVPDLCIAEYRERYAEFFSGEVVDVPGPKSLLHGGATSHKPFPSAEEELSLSRGSSDEDQSGDRLGGGSEEAGPFFNANRNPFTAEGDMDGAGIGGGHKGETTPTATKVTTPSPTSASFPSATPINSTSSSSSSVTGTSSSGTATITQTSQSSSSPLSSATTSGSETPSASPPNSETPSTTSPHPQNRGGASGESRQRQHRPRPPLVFPVGGFLPQPPQNPNNGLPRVISPPSNLFVTHRPPPRRTLATVQAIFIEPPAPQTTPSTTLTESTHTPTRGEGLLGGDSAGAMGHTQSGEEVRSSEEQRGHGLSGKGSAERHRSSSAIDNSNSVTEEEEEAETEESMTTTPQSGLPGSESGGQFIVLPMPHKRREFFQVPLTKGQLQQQQQCEDTHDLCCFWAIAGECERNPFWMRVKCAKTCGTCNCSLKDADRCKSTGIKCHLKTTTKTTTSTSTTTTTTPRTTTTTTTETPSTTITTPAESTAHRGRGRSRGRTRPPHFGGSPPGEWPPGGSRPRPFGRKGKTKLTTNAPTTSEGGGSMMSSITTPPGGTNLSETSSASMTTSMAGVTQQPPPPGCTNSNNLCKFWAELGECDTNPFWMRPNCQLSCNSCGESILDVLPVRTRPGCENRHRFCPFWSFVGECAKNPRWMTSNCRASCQLC